MLPATPAVPTATRRGTARAELAEPRGFAPAVTGAGVEAPEQGQALGQALGGCSSRSSFIRPPDSPGHEGLLDPEHGPRPCLTWGLRRGLLKRTSPRG